MSKCGKGCMPECEYFTTGGCISPFNCMYKEESKYINSATSGTVIYAGGMNMTNEEMVENLKCVIADISAQCERLKSENAALRERLSRAVELPAKVGDTVYLLSQTSRCPSGEIVEAKIIDFIGWKDGYRFTAKGGGEWFSFLRGDIGTWVFTTRETAEACLKELKEKSND